MISLWFKPDFRLKYKRMQNRSCRLRRLCSAILSGACVAGLVAKTWWHVSSPRSLTELWWFYHIAWLVWWVPWSTPRTVHHHDEFMSSGPCVAGVIGLKMPWSTQRTVHHHDEVFRSLCGWCDGSEDALIHTKDSASSRWSYVFRSLCGWCDRSEDALICTKDSA